MNGQPSEGMLCLLLLVLMGSTTSTYFSFTVATDALTLTPLRQQRSTMALLSMGKGFNKARNKQAELAKKMALAKSQNREKQGDRPNEREEKSSRDTYGCNIDEADDKRKLRQNFEKLLETTKGAMPSGDDEDSAHIAPIQAGSKLKKKSTPAAKQVTLTKQKASEKRKLEEDRQRENGRIMEAQRLHFELLVDLDTSVPLGAIGAATLVPWVPPFVKTGLIVLADPRSNSNDLRRAMKYQHSSSLQSDGGNTKNGVDVVFVTADSIEETKAWLKRNEMGIHETTKPKSKLSDSKAKIRVFSDPRLSFMTSYEIVGDDVDRRWSLTMLVFDTDGNVLKLERDIDPSNYSLLISTTIRDLRKNG